MISIAIIDDHEIVRIGLKALLSQEDDIEVLQEYENASMVKDHLEEIEEHIDLILLDLELPDVKDLELLELLNSHLSRPKIIILTSHSEEEYAVKAIRKGARGFLTKSFDIEIMKQAIISVMNGGLFLTPNATNLLHFGKKKIEKNITTINSIIEPLSERERLVFHYICEGLTLKEISFEMGCSRKSISTYKSRLMEKLDARSIVDIIVIGVNNGFITQVQEA